MEINKQIVKCSAYGNVEISKDYKTISEVLADNRVVKIVPNTEGEFDVIEMSDEYFVATLTAGQLADWGRELIELSKQK